jgi:hypothetical protein
MPLKDQRPGSSSSGSDISYADLARALRGWWSSTICTERMRPRCGLWPTWRSEFTYLSLAANDTDVTAVTHFAATAPATGKSAAMDIHQ